MGSIKGGGNPQRFEMAASELPFQQPQLPITRGHGVGSGYLEVSGGGIRGIPSGNPEPHLHPSLRWCNDANRGPASSIFTL